MLSDGWHAAPSYDREPQPVVSDDVLTKLLKARSGSRYLRIPL